MKLTINSKMKYEVILVLTLLVRNTLYADKCTGKQRIVKKPPENFDVQDGTAASLQWIYCNPESGAITGIIFYRLQKREKRLFGMDVTGKSAYYEAGTPKRHQVTWKQKHGTIIFSIKKVSMDDAGVYRLVIRRQGRDDLRDRIRVIVREKVILKPSSWTSNNGKNIKTSRTVMISSSKIKSHGANSTAGVHTERDNQFVITPSSGTSDIEKKKQLSSLYVPHPYQTKMAQPKVPRTFQSSTLRHSVAISKTSIEKDTHEEYGIAVVIMICILAGMAPIALLLVTIAVYKLRRRRKKRKRDKNRRCTASAQSEERDLMSPRSTNGTSNNEDFDGQFSVSTMSGFSYRDSLEHYSSSEQQLPSSVTFGIRQPELPKAYQVSPSTFTPLIGQDPHSLILPEGKNYELEREVIQNMTIVGQGAFGLVARATMCHKNSLCTVAVKMLREFASNEDRKDLIAECNLMRRLDAHKNVVQLLGYVLQSEPIWVVTEYIVHGDLLGFLRKCRGIQDSVYHGVTAYSGTSLTQEELLIMAKDIACGMAHLAQNKIIHRDLAARNVLVDENINCKITDFGMARDVKSTNYYRIRNRGRIPFKWTAIEAILYDKYTTMSDVWSYGIVLYEIVTIGGSPYPSLGPRGILQKLKKGWRMEKPDHVSNDLYNVMLKCWAAQPEERPSFLLLAGIFGTILGNQSQYINLEELKGLYDPDSCSSETSGADPCR